MRRYAALLPFLIAACASAPPPSTSPYTLVLGIAQDGGYPQAGCNRADCVSAWRDPKLRRRVASLAIIDPQSHQRWMLDATPDFPSQLRTIEEAAPRSGNAPLLDGILLTHAHIGHYLGLAQLGREVLGAKSIPVYATPSMAKFLRENRPWSRLVAAGNIDVREIEPGKELELTPSLHVTPIRVPHRDEDSDTVAYLVRGPAKKLLWLPDIDKWEKWDRRLTEILKNPDVTAFVDGTFFSAEEIP